MARLGACTVSLRRGVERLPAVAVRLFCDRAIVHVESFSSGALLQHHRLRARRALLQLLVLEADLGRYWGACVFSAVGVMLLILCTVVIT